MWWPDRQAVAAHYAGGEYGSAVDELRTAKGDQSFRHELVPASLVISNFSSGEGELLARNTAGYDHRQQVESVRRLLEAVDALRKWEVER